MRLIIDAEIQRLLPGQTKEENETMKSSIKEHGCLNPLIAWKQTESIATLLDGRHRWQFCKDNKISYDTKYIKLPNMSAARQWVIDHQLGRRNLNPTQSSYYRGLDYLNNKDLHGGDRKGAENGYESGHLTSDIGKKEKSSCQNDNLILSGNTAEDMAEKHGVSPRTILRDAEFSEAVDAIAEDQGEETKAAILSGSVDATKQEIVEIAKNPGRKRVLCESCAAGSPKKKCPKCKSIRGAKKKPGSSQHVAETDISCEAEEDPKDKNGLPWPSVALPGIKAAEVLNNLRMAVIVCLDIVKELQETQIVKSVEFSSISSYLNQIKDRCNAGKPSYVCPYCDGTNKIKAGRSKGDKCTTCYGNGWVTSSVYKNAPSEFKREAQV